MGASRSQIVSAGGSEPSALGDHLHALARLAREFRADADLRARHLSYGYVDGEIRDRRLDALAEFAEATSAIFNRFRGEAE
jgi:hypothetical protein